jgi:hypothetical protein
MTDIYSNIDQARAIAKRLSKYPPAEPGALVLEPLEAACPCRFSSAALLRWECLNMCRNNPP